MQMGPLLKVFRYSVVIIALLSSSLAFSNNDFVSPECFLDQMGEFLIDTGFIYGPAPGFQGFPTVVFGDSQFFIVWEGSRYVEASDIYGTRMTTDGIIVDSIGRPICTSSGYQQEPAIAFDGNNYFVVWEDYRYGAARIFGKRINQFGVVLDTVDIIISFTPAYTPKVAFDGTNYLVVWEDARSGTNNSNIYGARVDLSGIVLDPGGFPISIKEERQITPNIAFDGMNYLVIWADLRNGGYDIFGARVSPNGTVLDPDGIPVTIKPGDQLYPALAFCSGIYLAAWTDCQNNDGFDIHGVRINPEGVIIDTTEITISSALHNQRRPAISFDGSNFLVVWEDDRDSLCYFDIYGARISQSGVVLDTAGILLSMTPEEIQCYSAVAFDGEKYLAVWYGFTAGQGSDIYGIRVSPGGHTIDSCVIVISTGIYFYPQHAPALAFDSTNYFVVWEDARNDQGDIYGARVSCAGTILDSVCIPVSTAPNFQGEPAVEYDGENYFVVWSDERNGNGNCDIYGARVSRDGTVLDTSGIPISVASNTQCQPAIIFDGSNYLIVWADRRNGVDYDIYGSRVTPNGMVLDTIIISATSGYQWRPALAFDGINNFVVWEDYRNNFAEIYGCRITRGGVVLDSGGIPISQSPNNRCNPAIAFGGTNYLVIWEESMLSTYWDIYGCRVTTSGVVIDSTGILVSNAPNSQSFPAIAFDGVNYMVVWQDSRNEILCDIWGAKLSPEGLVVGSFSVITAAGSQISPAITTGADSILIVYSGWCDSIAGFPAKVMHIWGKFALASELQENVVVQKPLSRSISLYPNPFKNYLKICISFYRSEKYNLEVYNILGQKVRTIYRGEINSGSYAFLWDGKDDLNCQLSSGTYYIVHKTESFTTVAKAILIR